MKYYFYKTIHLRDWSFYYGSGSKENYFGSGKILKRKIKKYGVNEFLHIRLRYFNTREEAYNFEDRFLKLYKITTLEKCMNLKESGNGGDTYNNKNIDEKIKRNKLISLKLKEKYKNEDHHMIGKKLSIETKIKLSSIRKGELNNFYGKKHNDESKKKMGSKGLNHIKCDLIKYNFINGDKIEICTSYELYTKYNLNAGHIRSVVRGLRKSHKGWKIKNDI